MVKGFQKLKRKKPYMLHASIKTNEKNFSGNWHQNNNEKVKSECVNVIYSHLLCIIPELILPDSHSNQTNTLH
jgi:hypothetical protein